MAKYEKITRYAGRLAEDPGKWTKPVKRGNCLTLSEFEPSEAMSAFVNDFLADYWPELQDYAEILGEVGIDPVYSSTADFDMGALDSRVVLALLMKAIRADRFCEGALEEAAKTGFLDECFARLMEIDAEADVKNHSRGEKELQPLGQPISQNSSTMQQEDGRMEFNELTKEETEEWERYYDDDFESYDDETLDDEARDLLCDIARATVIYGDAAYLLGIRVHQGAAMQRWQSNPTVAAFARRAYEHFVAQGHAGACCNLGAMYNSGEGVEQSYEKARELYQMGADLGDDQASVNFGYIYYYGRSSEGVDYAKAYECYARGVFLGGNPEAYWKLGDLYAGGLGVRQSDWMAWLMYSKAYENGRDTIFAGRAAHHVADYLMAGIEGKLECDPERALVLYAEAEVGYRRAIQEGLGYYQKCLEEAVDGQQSAREAVIELRRPRRRDD